MRVINDSPDAAKLLENCSEQHSLNNRKKIGFKMQHRQLANHKAYNSATGYSPQMLLIEEDEKFKRKSVTPYRRFRQ
jgi:hypothetical protein